MLGRKVFKVWHTVIRAGVNVGHFKSDLIFENGIPTVVFEWMQTPDGEIPATTVSLDPARLHKFGGPGWKDLDYLYELPVEDPRRLS